MKKYIYISLIIIFTFSSFISTFAQKAKNEEDKKYIEVLTNRSNKILDDYVKMAQGKSRDKVLSIMVKQYWDVNKINDGNKILLRDKKKELSREDYEVFKTKTISKEEATLTKCRLNFEKKLSKYLTVEEIILVKDGITLGAYAHNYNGYIEMIPTLTSEEKAYISNQFSQARDKAMVMSSSKDRLEVFRQYKGKINNWLSTERGYDLKKEGEEWQNRIKSSQ